MKTLTLEPNKLKQSLSFAHQTLQFIALISVRWKKNSISFPKHYLYDDDDDDDVGYTRGELNTRMIAVNDDEKNDEMILRE